MLPLLVEPDTLQSSLDDPHLLILDVGARESYDAYHLPGAIHVDYNRLVGELPSTPGPLPDHLPFTQLLCDIGLQPEHRVIAYDDGDNAQACRLLWSLDLIGHRHYALLDGGLRAWLDERHPVEQTPTPAQPVRNHFHYVDNAPVADLLYILQHLDDPEVCIVDARTPEEYRGEDLRAQRGGHIPGAINLDHRRLLDPDHSLRLRPEAQLRAIVEEAGLDPEKELICHCQSHRRSALVYIALKALGFPRLKAYPGSWAEWGNNLDTPIE